MGLLFIANTINIGADLAAMGAAAKLVLGWGQHVFTVALRRGLADPADLRPLSPLCPLSEMADAGALRLCRRDLHRAHRLERRSRLRTLMPQLALTGATVTLVVAIFGTTISPYLFFWQASEEVEDDEADPTHRAAARASRAGASS